MEPLAYKYRPVDLDEFVGQRHLLSSTGPIRKFIETGNIPSMIFWGPPGTGKTTLALIIARKLDYKFCHMSATKSGKSDLNNLVGEIGNLFTKKVILFLDEIHRWNKAQQDYLLPYVESGKIILIGATTENPSFSINSALLSRCKVYIFNRLEVDDIAKRLHMIIKNVKKDTKINISEKTVNLISDLSNGDLRSAINILEMSINLRKGGEIDSKTISAVVQKQIYSDKQGEEHYNIISAIHKSMRSSNASASGYWVMRLLEAGEDPLYIARRLLRFASEDIGNADPQAFVLADSVFAAVKKVGMPECDVFLIQLAMYLSRATKDNRAYVVTQKVREDVKKHGNLPVPMHLRNASTKLMKTLGYGKGYEYDHDLSSKKSKQQCMPDKLRGKTY